MLAQDQEGWVTKAAIEHVADMLGMPYIRALEVATFYTQFQLKPVGTRAHVQVCGTTPCMLRGAEALMDVCRSKIHHDQFHTNDDGTLSWEEVECLGACVNAPMVMIFKDTYEDLTPERLGEIIDAFAAGKGDERADRPADRSHRLGAAIRPDDAARREGGAEIDARQGSARRGCAKRSGCRRRPPRCRRHAAVQCRQAEDRRAGDQRGDQVAVRRSRSRRRPKSDQRRDAPKHDAANANKASEQVEKTDKQRSPASPTTRRPDGASPAMPQRRSRSTLPQPEPHLTSTSSGKASVRPNSSAEDGKTDLGSRLQKIWHRC